VNRHYQALCRHKSPEFGFTSGVLIPAGEPFTVRHILSGDPESAKRSFKEMLEGEGYHVISVTELYAEVNWSKPVLDLDEAAELTNIRGATLSAKKANGEIPWNPKINGVPTRIYLKSIESGLNKCGKELVAALEKTS
jgi:hypothetical protein